jgi:hypothetical protein
MPARRVKFQLCIAGVTAKLQLGSSRDHVSLILLVLCISNSAFV